jgi:hypothetical protein
MSAPAFRLPVTHPIPLPRAPRGNGFRARAGRLPRPGPAADRPSGSYHFAFASMDPEPLADCALTEVTRSST